MITREKMIPTATVRQDVQDKKAVSQTSLFIGLYAAILLQHCGGAQHGDQQWSTIGLLRRTKYCRNVAG
jgi:hypothetical protein